MPEIEPNPHVEANNTREEARRKSAMVEESTTTSGTMRALRLMLAIFDRNKEESQKAKLKDAKKRAKLDKKNPQDSKKRRKRKAKPRESKGRVVN